MINILFICHGNICRSPMAEFILKDLVRASGRDRYFQIDSAAVSLEEIGCPIYPPAQRCLREHNIPFDPAKRARQVTRADYARYDYIICMDSFNLRMLRHIIPSDPDDKIYLLMSFVENDDINGLGSAASFFSPPARRGHSGRGGRDGSPTSDSAGKPGQANGSDRGRDQHHGHAHAMNPILARTLPEGRDVADPWYTGDFETTYQDLLTGCQALLDFLYD